MAILNFPINPNHNDLYSANGIEYLYDSNSTSWAVQPNLGYTGSTGFTGSKGAGFTGSKGDLGYTGSQGDIGYTGSQGNIGYTGSSQSQGIRYAYDDNTTHTGALTGEIRFNNATIGSATAIGIHVTDANANNMTDYFTGLDNFGDAANNFFGYLQIRPADVSDGTSQIFKVESVFSLASSVLSATISNVGGSISLTDTDQILITFIPAVKGAIGYTGSQGVIGYTGSKGDQGVIGYTGSKGDIGYTGSKGDQGNDGTSINIAGSVPNVNAGGNPQATLNAAFPTASAGDGVVDQTLGDLWTYDGATWTNVGQFVGYTGSQGAIGYTGSKGDQGVIGYTGSKGDIGYTGSRGPIGYTGSRGAIGYTGSQGIIGYTGSRGVTGFTGSKGDLGYTGSQGASGGGTGIAIAMAMIFG